MAQDLMQYLREHPCRGFRPVPHYFPSGDYVTYYLRNVPAYAQRVDDLLTVYLTFDSNELVGCKIKRVKHILETAGNFGVTMNDHTVQLGLFFFVGAANAKDESQKRRYDEIGRLAKDATLDLSEVSA